MTKIVNTISIHGPVVTPIASKVGVRGSNPSWACPQMYFSNFGIVQLKIL